MTATTTTFFDVEAEQCIIGACLIQRSAIEPAARVLVPADFGSPHLADAFAAMLRLHREGVAIDAKTVTDQMGRDGTGWDEMAGDLARWTLDVPSTAAIGRYAEIVTRRAARRALHGVGVELVAAAKDPTRDPGDVADEARIRLASLDQPNITGRPGDVDFGDLIAEEDESRADPVVPGLLAEDDRVVIVAPEGVGKSELARQMVTTAAWGIHPFSARPIPAVPTLLVDLENPRDLVRRRIARLTTTAAIQATTTRAPAVLWHRPGGIDLRRRPDRLALEDVLRRNRPRLVCAGPVYKMYTRSARETDEQVASEVQGILDDLRTRFGFALVLEHHAPQANGGARELRPFGSSLWLRWPEYGLKLTPSRDRSSNLVVGRWRGDRNEAAWPDEIHRSDVWPWAGWWKAGVPDDPEDAF